MRLTIKKMLVDINEYVESTNGKLEKVKYNWNIEGSTIYYSLQKLLNKLGQLEDIEEELGIDLITLFKALKNGYYYKRHNRILYSRDVAYALCRNELKLDKTVGLLAESVLKPQNNICVYVRDYGKTWALTKEELEK